MKPRSRVRQSGAAALLVAALVACAPMHPLPLREDHGPTVSVPLALAGVRDERAAFAALMARELAARGEDPSTTRWLHGGVAPEDPRLASVDDRFAAQARTTSVLIVPGLFEDCVQTQSVPFGDGVVRSAERSLEEAYRQYADLGLLGLRALPLPGREGAAANGRRVAAALRAESARSAVGRIVVIAYSKGLTDTLRALGELRRDGDLPRTLTDVVSIAGPVMGTPLADHVGSLFESVSPMVEPLDCTPSDGQELKGMTRSESIAWLENNPLPAALRLHSVLAYASHDMIGPALRPTYRFLATFDPRNDGQVIASDAILPGGALLAEARADHWGVALPLDRHPNFAVRMLSAPRAYPREALLRTIVKWVLAQPGPAAAAP